jgi:adenylate cyclase
VLYERTPDKENAINCVKMAIEMQDKMKKLQYKWYNGGFKNPLHIRIGVSTGTSTVGNFGAENRFSYTAIGGQVNIAARLEGICEPDAIMISHSTWAFVKDEIECYPGDKVSVKGINREIMTHKVLSN